MPGLLRKTRETVENGEKRESSKQVPALAMRDPHLAHLVDLASRDRTIGYQAVCTNFRMAALHLSYIMKMPGVEEDKAILPDIPDTVAELLPDTSDPCSPVLSNWLKITDIKSSALMRLPLHLAMAISPICILGTRQVYKLGGDRQNIIQVSRIVVVVQPV